MLNKYIIGSIEVRTTEPILEPIINTLLGYTMRTYSAAKEKDEWQEWLSAKDVCAEVFHNIFGGYKERYGKILTRMAQENIAVAVSGQDYCSMFLEILNSNLAGNIGGMSATHNEVKKANGRG